MNHVDDRISLPMKLADLFGIDVKLECDLMIPLARSLAHPWQFAITAVALILLLLLRRGVVTTLLAAGAAGVIIALAGGLG